MTTELLNAPTDAISRILFGVNDFLLASSWDGRLRLYDVKANSVRGIDNRGTPLLDCCFTRGLQAASGGLNNEVRTYDFDQNHGELLGRHDGAVRCVRYSESLKSVITGSWDRTIACWDLRAKSIAHRIALNSKVFGLCVTPETSPFDKIISIDQDKKVSIFDCRRFDTPEEVRDNVLKYQMRCIEAMSDGKGFAIGSTEGRVAYEYFNPTLNETRNSNGNGNRKRQRLSSFSTTDAGTLPGGPPEPPKDGNKQPTLPGTFGTDPETLGAGPDAGGNLKSYAFRCHREKLPNSIEEKIYPVNAISFHPRYHTFATGGSDGLVSVWDGSSKKRLWKLNKPFLTGITSMAFNGKDSGADLMALSISYDFSDNGNPPADLRLANYAQIIIRQVNEQDIAPKR